MKLWMKKQLTNIVFLVLIVAAALTIYLLSRATPTDAAAQAQDTAPISSPVPSASPSAEVRGVPEAVLRTHLASSELYAAKASEEDGSAWTLTLNDSPAFSADVLYTVQNGAVTSMEVTFALPSAYDDKGTTSIDQYLHETSKKQAEALPGGVRAILSDLFPACDIAERLSLTSTRYWAEQALLLEKPGEDFKDTQNGCRFYALRTTKGKSDVLICTLFLE